ncbi:DegV family protein [Candidatus Mycoplasma mahonii]|uniref:DegV family protein n=1 Tax=Candidatus Mycoplasma mahonii TaxID=3004105 RepID=UPI0026EF0441|nr:DegV family protein [Candidatus Mycoplasma mahonii]WKX02665.1 DegV family protein [Candidatus Mycoplasma mahonii]
MKKIGILVDSFCGFSKKEVEKMGLEYINHSTIIFDKVYKEGIEIELKDSFEDIQKDLGAKTSLPSVGLFIEKFEEISNKYENIVYLPMNKGLSSTFSVAMAAAADFPKISVIENKLVSSSTTYTSLEAIKMVNNGASIEEAINFINETSNNTFVYVIPKDLDALIRSGRLNNAKKFIMQKSKLIPRLDLGLDGIKVTKVGRNFGKIVKSSVTKIVKSIDHKIENYNWEVIHSGIKKTSDIVVNAYHEAGIKDVIKSWTSSVVAIHTGIGAICINVFPKFSK